MSTERSTGTKLDVPDVKNSNNESSEMYMHCNRSVCVYEYIFVDDVSQLGRESD